MSTYIIGDVQGCYAELQQLLQLIQFNPNTDRLGFVGDLVNRGPDSLQVLRFIRSLQNPLIVLGNHDLYLLIIGYDLVAPDTYPHTLHAILEAPDKYELLNWLRHQSLVYHDKKHNALLVHAGLPPQWSIRDSGHYANEVERTLQGEHFRDFLTHLFGDTPAIWDTHLKGIDRLRYIVNAFTRMRICDQNGALDLASDTTLNTESNRFQPWFNFRKPEKDKTAIIFGHWAALNGQCDTPHCYALDTGCAWGYALTALRLEDKARFSIPCAPLPNNRERRNFF